MQIWNMFQLFYDFFMETIVKYTSIYFYPWPLQSRVLACQKNRHLRDLLAQIISVKQNHMLGFLFRGELFRYILVNICYIMFHANAWEVGGGQIPVR